MFSLNYFWYFMAACFTVSPVITISFRRELKFFSILGLLTLLSMLVFLIIGFWKMPSWWMPLAMLALGYTATGAGAALLRSNLSLFVCSFASVILVIISYMMMFGVIQTD